MQLQKLPLKNLSLYADAEYAKSFADNYDMSLAVDFSLAKTDEGMRRLVSECNSLQMPIETFKKLHGLEFDESIDADYESFSIKLRTINNSYKIPMRDLQHLRHVARKRFEKLVFLTSDIKNPEVGFFASVIPKDLAHKIGAEGRNSTVLEFDILKNQVNAPKSLHATFVVKERTAHMTYPSDMDKPSSEQVKWYAYNAYKQHAESMPTLRVMISAIKSLSIKAFYNAETKLAFVDNTQYRYQVMTRRDWAVLKNEGILKPCLEMRKTEPVAALLSRKAHIFGTEEVRRFSVFYKTREVAITADFIKSHGIVGLGLRNTDEKIEIRRMFLDIVHKELGAYKLRSPIELEAKTMFTEYCLASTPKFLNVEQPVLVDVVTGDIILDYSIDTLTVKEDIDACDFIVRNLDFHKNLNIQIYAFLDKMNPVLYAHKRRAFVTEIYKQIAALTMMQYQKFFIPMDTRKAKVKATKAKVKPATTIEGEVK